MSSKKLTPEEQATKLEALLSENRGQGQKALMGTLKQAQEIYGYLPLFVQRKVAYGFLQPSSAALCNC